MEPQKRTYRTADETVNLPAAEVGNLRAFRLSAVERMKRLSAEDGNEHSVDIVHLDGVVEGRKNARPVKVYERLVFRNGSLDLYLYFNPLLGLTAEEREVMRGEEAPRRRPA